ncbi:RNA helicase [Vibrio makurazakiensis]|uniref:RNA helicase n=1 Tax=Vibrio makurazakiensis TaxID=2910250 RepID=UPI003D095D4E
MAELCQLNGQVEYEVCYFEDGSLKTILLEAECRDEALQIYSEQGCHLNDLYSIRPDK